MRGHVNVHTFTSNYINYYICSGIPPASSNVIVTILSTESSGSDPHLTVNLTWFQNRSHCVEVYQVEVTTANSFTSRNTTSQHAVLELRTGQVYLFRVRGIDSANRLGNWSTKLTYTATGKTPYLIYSYQPPQTTEKVLIEMHCLQL